MRLKVKFVYDFGNNLLSEEKEAALINQDFIEKEVDFMNYWNNRRNGTEQYKK